LKEAYVDEQWELWLYCFSRWLGLVVEYRYNAAAITGVKHISIENGFPV
jgi:hypothetical protein